MTLFAEIQQLASAAQACATAADVIRTLSQPADPTMPAMPMGTPSYLPPGIDAVNPVLASVRNVLKAGELAELDAGCRTALEEIQKRVALAIAALTPAADPATPPA